MTPEPLKKGSDSRRNWKTINDCIAEQKQIWNAHQTQGTAIAELRRRHLDTGGGGGTNRVINRGLYDPDDTYYADQWVEFTPSGGQAGQYWCLEDGTTGVDPDTGAPSWTQTKYPSPGVWGS